MHVGRLHHTLYRLVYELAQLVGALLVPAVLLLWLLDVLEVAAQRTLLKRDLPYPRLRDGVKVEWQLFGGNTRMTTRWILSLLSLLLLALPLAAQPDGFIFVYKGRTDGGSGIPGFPELDTPIFSALLNEGAGTTPAYTGSDGLGTCTSTALGWDAGPPITADGNGTTTIINCGNTGGSLMPVTVEACIEPHGWGENNAGYVFSTQNSSGALTLGVYIGATNTRVGAFVLDTTNNSRLGDANGSMTVGDSTWKHVVWSVSNCATLSASCVFKVWVDGVAKTVTPSGTATGTKRVDELRSIMNRANDTARTFDGFVNRVKVYAFEADDSYAAEMASRANCGGGS
jgi:hypothetical protein